MGIVAESGLGKSRLVAEVMGDARQKGFVGYGSACQSDAISTPYHVWKNIWRAFFDVDLDSLHTLILSRIDRLSEREKSTLRAAGIIGRLFPAKWLTGYYPELGGLPQVEESLEQLHALDITPLESPEPELAYLFKHIVTHEAAHESLPFATRAQLHERQAAPGLYAAGLGFGGSG